MGERRRRWQESYDRLVAGVGARNDPGQAPEAARQPDVAPPPAGATRWAVYRWSGNPAQQQGKLISVHYDEVRARKDFEVHAGMGRGGMVRLYADGVLVEQAVRR